MKHKILFLNLLIITVLNIQLWAQEKSTLLSVHFDQTLQDWDGFGVNYVQTRHTRDFDVYDQDYGGMKYLNEPEREQLIQLVFGDDGLQPALIKCFLDPFHEPENDNNDPYEINNDAFNHEKTTKYIRFFLEEGLKLTKQRNEDLTVLAGLYGPPGWMSKQKTFRGRDLDPEMTDEVAEYLVAWAIYLKNEYGANVRYISFHNEGEAYNRWPQDGKDDPTHYGHDFNMFWSDDNVVDFIISARSILDHHGLKNIGISTGEPSIWRRLYEYSPTEEITINYAGKISESKKAMASLGLITSHGFDYGGDQFDSRAIDLLRKSRPDLHAWTTSCTWGDMSLEIVEQARGYIYEAGNNGIIPWATVHNNYESDRLHPPRGFRISGNANSPIQTSNGVLKTTKAYYYFKHLCRSGRPGMKPAKVNVKGTEKISAIAFASNGTKYQDALLVINHDFTTEKISIEITGIQVSKYAAFYTQDYGEANYTPFGEEVIDNNMITIEIPERSVVTLFLE